MRAAVPMRFTRALSHVVVHAPAGFEPSRPFHIVLFAHSLGTYAAQWVGSGEVEVLPGQPTIGWGLDARTDAARAQTLLVAPQFNVERPGQWAGRFAQPGFLREFLTELLGETLAPRLGGARSLADVEGITLAGSSAGGPAIHTLLARGGVADKVRNVVVLDGMYRSADAYLAWLARDRAARRRLVVIDTGYRASAPHVRALVADARRMFRGEVAVDPDEPLADAVRRNRVVVERTPLQHVWLALLYFTKVLEGLELPPRAAALREEPKARTMVAGPSAPAPLATGQRVAGELAAGDTRVGDGALADDYALELAAGARVELVARGGPSRTEYRAPLDVYLAVLREGRVLAADDDGAGRFGSLVRFTAPSAGRYLVRVTTHGPMERRGPYTLSAAAQ